MVEERTDSLETTEENELQNSSISRIPPESSASPINVHGDGDDPQRRASFGACNAGRSSTRNSTEKSHSSKSRQTVVPRYLRASMGSCHDLCKYGRKFSDEEEKARLAVWKRNVKKLPNELIPVQIFVPGEKRKDKVVNHKPSTEIQRHSLNLKPSDDAQSCTTKLKTSLEKAKAVENKPSADAKSNSADFSSRDIKSYQPKTRASLDGKPSSQIQSVTHLTKQKPLPAKKLPSPDPPEVIKNVCFPSEKVEVPGKKGSWDASKVLKPEKTAVLSRQHSAPLKLTLVKVNPSLSLEKPDVMRGKEQRTGDAGTAKNLAAIKASTSKILSPRLSVVKIATIKSRKDGGLKLVSPLKEKNRVRRVKTSTSNNEKVSEKTLHVIKTKTGSNAIVSILDDYGISSYPSLSAEASSGARPSSLVCNKGDGGIENADVSDSHESPKIVNIPPVEEKQSKTVRKNRLAVSEVRYGSPVKLKFISGKVVDLKSDNHSPRKLRFRRARVLGGEESKSSLGRTLKKGGARNDNVASADESSEKVVLKHQDIEDKKDAQGLFNNVIEETASKLVKKRKSKVKALVGAFETVISLQESKTSSSAAS